MLVEIPNNKLKRSIENDSERQRRYGKEMAKKIQLMMGALVAAQTVGDFWPPYSPPERCHELKGELVGKFSMDLTHPYRLLFKPATTQAQLSIRDQANAESGDQKARWHSIDSIEIVGVEDTHG